MGFTRPDISIFYLPHRAVFRKDSVTTKTDCLFPGINLNPSIFQLLLNFRLNKIGISADVEKAFLQISLLEKDRDAIRFLFLEVTEDPRNKMLGDLKIQVYRFQRLFFGLNTLSYGLND